LGDERGLVAVLGDGGAVGVPVRAIAIRGGDHATNTAVGWAETLDDVTESWICAIALVGGAVVGGG